MSIPAWIGLGILALGVTVVVFAALVAGSRADDDAELQARLAEVDAILLECRTEEMSSL